jgi:multidrug efflux system outer membrane protein
MGPDYERPKVVVPQRWKEASPNEEALRSDWWELFGDPELAALEKKALGANQDLAGAVARVLEADAALRSVGSQRYPSLSLSPTAVRQRVNDGTFGQDDRFVTGNSFTVPLSLSYEVDLWGRVRRSVEAAQADFQATRADQEVVRLGIVTEVAQTWFLLRHADLDRKLLQETMDLRRQTLTLVETRVRNGIASDLEVAQSRIELAQAESDLAFVARTRAVLEHTMARLTGEPASNVSFPNRPLDLALPRLPLALPSELLERRPDVALAERKMAAANARIGQAKTAYFPTLDLAALAGFQSYHIEHLFNASNRIWSIGGSATQPIFRGGEIEAGVDFAQAQYEEALANYRQRVLVAFQEVEDALSDLRWLTDQARAQDELFKAAQQAVVLARRRYEEGLSSLLDLVDAQRSFLQAQRGLSQVYRDRLLASVQLLRALGGGWNAEELSR